MDEFYRVLSDYNQRLPEKGAVEVGWAEIFRSDQPPRYWTAVAEIVSNLPRDYFCVEIGGGCADICSLLLHLGFKSVCCIEREARLADAARAKLDALFGRGDCVLTAEYPITTAKRPNLLLQVNCVYADGVVTQEEYLKRLRLWHAFNGIPDLFLLETVDASFTGEHPSFPVQVRLSEHQVRTTFAGFDVESTETYQFPVNRSTKRLYAIHKPGAYNAACANYMPVANGT